MKVAGRATFTRGLMAPHTPSAKSVFVKYCPIHSPGMCIVYTLLQKKRKFSKVAFLLEKIVCQWTLGHTCQGQ